MPRFEVFFSALVFQWHNPNFKDGVGGSRVPLVEVLQSAVSGCVLLGRRLDVVSCGSVGYLYPSETNCYNGAHVCGVSAESVTSPDYEFADLFQVRLIY